MTTTTSVKGVLTRGGSFVAVGRVEGRQMWRSFSTFEEAVAYRRHLLALRARMKARTKGEEQGTQQKVDRLYADLRKLLQDLDATSRSVRGEKRKALEVAVGDLYRAEDSLIRAMHA